MANKYPNSEATPANTDDALEGPQRIREIKQAYNERLSRDHIIGGVTSPDVIAQGADSNDSGYHRRLTIKEETSAKGSEANTRLNGSNTGINDSTTAKMAEVWVEKHSGTGDETSICFIGTEGAGNHRYVATTTQTQTLTNKTLTAPVINDATLSGGSGSINGVAIGTRAADAGADPAVTAGAAAGKFTTLESTGNTIIGGADTDTLVLKAATSGLSSDESGYAGANKFYAGLAGEVRMFAGGSAPSGWLLCDGSQYVKADKAELYAVIGDIYNAPGNSVNSGSYANYIASSSYFRVPDMRGRIPIGAGTGKASYTTAGADGLHPSETLTARTLGDYGADETHKLTAGESGAGPHYHAVDPQAHTHGVATFTDYNPDQFSTRNGITNSFFATNGSTTGWRADPVYDTTSVTTTIKASGSLDTTEADETNSNAFRVDKTDLNSGVKAASSHTQMQPFLVMNYIIKY